MRRRLSLTVARRLKAIACWVAVPTAVNARRRALNQHAVVAVGMFDMGAHEKLDMTPEAVSAPCPRWYELALVMR